MTLANKYRPKSFEDVCEQGLVTNILSNMCRSELANRNFLLIGPAGTGKTTLARIIGNTLNEGECEPIEIDAASNSGVDAMRDIVGEARSYPIGNKFKIFIIDECMTGDTEILTNFGYKRMDNLNESDLIAQYTDNGNIEFVKPIRLIKKHFEGDLVCWQPIQGHTIKMTPHHVQPLHFVKSNSIKESYIKDVKFNQANELIVAGNGIGNSSELSPMDRLAIASQADGCIQFESSTYNMWLISLKKQRKIERILNLFKEANVEYNEISSIRPDVRRFTYKMPKTVSKKLSSYFSLDFNYDRARQFIEEVQKWDGYVSLNYIEYLSIVKENTDFVSAVATLGGYSCKQVVVHDSRKETYKDTHKVFMYDTVYRGCQRIQKTITKEYFNGNVYCVEVPSHKIIVRAEGFTFVTGNCHALSSAAWQSLLKVLEESPARSVFIFCTTNPEKIPNTIISRVQTFQLSKISLNGIYNRLIHVLKNENTSGRNIIYSDDGVMFIAKLANGGMRDALTLLDKVLVYSNDINSKTVTEALNLPNYDNYFDLLSAVAKKDNTVISSVIHDVYNSGVNFVKWFEDFHSFVMNIVKYIFLQDINKTMIPVHYQDKISKYGSSHSTVCLRLANKLLNLNQELRTTNYQQEIALTYLCSAPTQKKQ
ncbi:MAG: AAA family ATPase [Clostridium sp.]|nr:AAA family ATPase [Clostridium sp.]